MATISLSLSLGTPAGPGDVARNVIRYLRLGPLAFPAPLSPLTESLGDGLEAVGPALVMAERRARPFALELAVHGNPEDTDERDTGMRLRRQARQLLENTRWRAQGIYFYFPADEELAGWLLVGGGDLEETDSGVTFGDFKLTLTDCYLRGRPGTHRPGRRLNLADRRGGVVALDTRGMLYNADWPAVPLPARPLILPGDVLGLTSSTGGAPASSVPGDTIARRTLFTECAAVDGEVISYRPNMAPLTTAGAAAPLELEEAGEVRVWDQRDGFTAASLGVDQALVPGNVGWERVCGPLLDYTRPLAMDNGLCRLVWVAKPISAGGGLALEQINPGTLTYERLGVFVGLDHVDAGPTYAEATVIELTPERGVIEWRIGPLMLRAILQRGWTGPRLEHYSTTSMLWLADIFPPVTNTTATTEAMVSQMDPATPGPNGILWAQGAASDDVFPGGPRIATVNPAPTSDVLVAQIAPVGAMTPADLASLAVVDARPEPVLLSRSV